MSTYIYKKISELEPGTQMHNFYGKVIFYGKEGDRLVLLVKDETGMMYVWVKPKEGQKLNFGVRQIVRVHRCIIGQSVIGKFGNVTIGKAGCHVVVWPKNGKTEKPLMISSKSWTKSAEDGERIKTLSELDVDGPPATVDRLAHKLISIREAQRAKVVVGKWLSTAKNEDFKRKNEAALEIFGNSPHSQVSANCSFKIDRTFFDETDASQFVQFFVTCPKCYEALREVRYVKDSKMRKCFRCKYRMKMEMAFRVRAEVENVNLIFTIPIHLLQDLQDAPDIDIDEFGGQKLENFVNMLQRKFWSSAIKDVRGFVAGRSEAWSFIEVLVQEAKFVGINDV